MTEVLVSSRLTALSGPLSYYRAHCLDALRYAYLCDLIDRDSADVLRLDVLLTDWLDYAQFGR